MSPRSPAVLLRTVDNPGEVNEQKSALRGRLVAARCRRCSLQPLGQEVHTPSGAAFTARQETAGNASTLSLTGEISRLFSLCDEVYRGDFLVSMFVHAEIVHWFHSLMCIPLILNNMHSNYHTNISYYSFKALTVIPFLYCCN